MKFKLIICVLLLVTLVSCQSDKLLLRYSEAEGEIQYSENSTEFTPLESTKEENIDSVEIIKEFETSRSLYNLENVELFWVDEDVYIEYYFSNRASMSDVQSAIDYYNRVFINEKTYALGPDEISMILDNKEMKKRVLKIYINEMLFIQTKYQEQDGISLDIAYFENHLLNYGIREEVDDVAKILNERNITKSKNIRVTRSFKPFTYIATVTSSTSDAIEIENIIKEISETIAENIDTLSNSSTNELIVNISRGNNIIQSKKLIINDDGVVTIVDTIWQ